MSLRPSISVDIDHADMRMISGEELKPQNGLAGLRDLGIALAYPINPNSQLGAFAFKAPLKQGKNAEWRPSWGQMPC